MTASPRKIPKSSTSATLPIARKRRSAPKNRSGCKTCKLRRVRCDETRPTCRNCQRLGLNCDGYLQLQPFNPETIVNPTEKRCFYYFHHQTRPQLASFPEHDFWDQLALQRSYSEETVRQVVIAIGAFHESLETTEPDLQLARRHTADCLYQHAISKAMASLPEMSTADVLLTCVLLAFLDNIKGDEWNAYKHVSGASAILEEHRVRNKTEGQSLIVNKVLAPIIQYLARLIHAVYAPSPATLLHPTFDAPIISFLDAHDQFRAAALDTTSQLSQPSPSAALENDCFSRLETWWEKFSDFLTRSEGITCQCEWPYGHAHHTLGALFLEVLYLTTIPRLHCALTGLELTLDPYEESYRRILDACEQLAQILNSSADMDGSARECIGFRPVYFTGCWMVIEACRDPVVRRRAISIMRKWPHTDSAWDTNLVADVADALIRREESGSPVQPVTASCDLPELARIRFLTVTYFELDVKSGMISLVYEAHRCDFMKISILRRVSNGEHSPHSEVDVTSTPDYLIEALWLDRRSGAKALVGFQFPASGMPILTGGLFPQAAAPPAANETRLWSLLQETRSGRELLDERRWKVVHPPIDRVAPREGKARDEVPKKTKGHSKRKDFEPRKPIWHEQLPSRSTPMEKRHMGPSLRAIVHDVC